MNQMFAAVTGKRSRDFYEHFFKTVLILWAGFTLLLGIFFHVQKTSILADIRNDEAASVSLAAASIAKDLDTNHSDLMFLADLLELKVAALEDGRSGLMTEDAKADLTQVYLKFSMRKGVYDQVRFLDLAGNEVVRVNYDHGRPRAVSPKELQNKAGRYYFDDAIRLGRDQLYISPFDLNIENNALELPYKPMLRFAAPTFDAAGKKTGVVVLNYLGDYLIEHFIQASQTQYGSPELVNSDGYWLHAEDAGNEWGFMFDGKKELTYAAKYPAAWDIIKQGHEGQFQNEDGLFTYEELTPFGDHLLTSDGSPDSVGKSTRAFSSQEYKWYLVSRLSNAVLDEALRDLYARILMIWSVMALLGIIISYFYVQNVRLRQEYTAKLHDLAARDALTGLPNRNSFNVELSKALTEARKKQQMLAVLFLDLDGFKLVNDIHGHGVGDLLLIETACRLKKALREEDMAARIGGDEFIVLLRELTDEAAVQEVQQRIMAAIEEPVLCGDAVCHVGTSIGAAVYPRDGDTEDTLITIADNEMYRVKKERKGNKVN